MDAPQSGTSTEIFENRRKKFKMENASQHMQIFVGTIKQLIAYKWQFAG